MHTVSLKRLVKNLVRGAINGLMFARNLGEGHSLLRDEQKVAIETAEVYERAALRALPGSHA